MLFICILVWYNILFTTWRTKHTTTLSAARTSALKDNVSLEIARSRTNGPNQPADRTERSRHKDVIITLDFTADFTISRFCESLFCDRWYAVEANRETTTIITQSRGNCHRNRKEKLTLNKFICSWFWGFVLCRKIEKFTTKI